MSTKQDIFSIAVLDDYQVVALSMADWSVLDGRATVTVFSNHLTDQDAIVARLQPFNIVCVMRERTPLSREILARLLLATPHIGYVSRGLYEVFYRDTVANIVQWLDGHAS